MLSGIFKLASLRGVPVNDEPCGVDGSNKPAVSTEHVDEQHSAGGPWSQTAQVKYHLY